MKTQHYVLAVGVMLVATLGVYAACGNEIGDLSTELGDDVVDAGIEEMPAPPETDDGETVAGQLPTDNDTPTQTQLSECGTNVCAADESCCRMDGTCYPSDCDDCCATFDEEAPPVIDRPDPTVLPREGLAGPEPGDERPPEEPVEPPEGVDRPQ